jgi:hypothetical protein
MKLNSLARAVKHILTCLSPNLGPYFFMSCALVKPDGEKPDPPQNALLGTLVSSLHKLKDTNNNDGGFFVFGDLSVKVEGHYRLQFNLFQMNVTGWECTHIASIRSKVFQVYPAKTFPGMSESTFLTRSFSDQGVRLRLRKDSRTMTTRKRNSAAARMSDEYYGSSGPPPAQRQRTSSQYDGGLHRSSNVGPGGMGRGMEPVRHQTHEPSQSPIQETPRQNSFSGYYDQRPPEPRTSVPPSQVPPQQAYAYTYGGGNYTITSPIAQPSQSMHPHMATTLAQGMGYLPAHDDGSAYSLPPMQQALQGHPGSMQHPPHTQ